VPSKGYALGALYTSSGPGDDNKEYHSISLVAPGATASWCVVGILARFEHTIHRHIHNDDINRRKLV
jgi:hypothetical protein